MNKICNYCKEDIIGEKVSAVCKIGLPDGYTLFSASHLLRQNMPYGSVTVAVHPKCWKEISGQKMSIGYQVNNDKKRTK